MAQPTQDYYLEATYEDGFVYKGTRKDVSLFNDGKNQFYDVYEGLLEKEHGKLVNWGVRGTNGTNYDINLTQLPADAVNIRPILSRNFERKMRVDGQGKLLGMDDAVMVSIIFGVQWNDAEGKNQKIVEELE